MQYREPETSDIAGMARIRAAEWGTQEFWERRIGGYLDGTHHPQQALMPRVSYVALAEGAVTGFVAGHLTRRYGCDGELEWINVIPEHRGAGVAAELLRLLAAWFAGQSAAKICVSGSISRLLPMMRGALM